MYTQEQWEEFDADGTKAMEKELKQVLEGVAQQLFGNVEARPGPVCKLHAPCLRQPSCTVGGRPGPATAPMCGAFDQALIALPCTTAHAAYARSAS